MGIISSGEGLGEVGGVLWRSSGWLQIRRSQMVKETGMECLVDEGWQLEK